jgi:hypothetical protein
MPKILTVNRGNSVMVSVVNQVNSATIRREIQNGESYIVVPSATLPDDVVMNGGLYPADEIEKSFMTLEGTHVPIEHPQDDQGQYISAGAPAAMRRGYLIGAENRNAKRESGRVYVEKWIPERIANGCDKGKRLIDRLNAIMKGQGEPIHTSTGILLERETVTETTAANGQKYNWIARNMYFDHDAILLDSIGAATPDQGVGIGVNSASIDGQVIEHLLFVNSTGLDMAGSPQAKIRELEQQIAPMREKLQAAIGEYLEAVKELDDAKEDLAEITGNGDKAYVYVESWNDDTVIYWCDSGYYSIGYKLESEKVLLTSEPARVKVETKFVSAMNAALRWCTSLFAADKKPAYNAKDEKVNISNEGSSMKLLIDALNAKGVKTDGMTDEQVLAAYNNMLSGSADQVVQAVNAAIKPLADELASVKAQLQANAEAGKTGMVADLVAKDIGLSETALKALELNELQSLHTKHCKIAAPGITGAYNQQRSAADDYDMPE